MGSLQAQVLTDAGQQETERTWLPAEAVARVHAEDLAVSPEILCGPEGEGRRHVRTKQRLVVPLQAVRGRPEL
ncbi:hypothetical protein CYMTET_10110 [Cymbomonas tetramitiformis]|uniref:Uncharacterized protein n=1 Tax=Cymbomonas tetramitiformis TaxID=36881 RepID=A0AAE0LE57_9CHLO|nr:hypothetical protein CYMTET_10110 [Cymbomonas tetramitiformis]